MKKISKPRPTPLGIYKLNAMTPEPYALFIFLDSVAYVEVKAKRMAEFTEALAIWKRENIASLRPPVNVRFFVKTELYINEVRF
jgi:hypothetical protein